MDQLAAKNILHQLIKRDDLDNKSCADCGNPNPQWASGNHSFPSITSYVLPSPTSQLRNISLPAVRRCTQRFWRAHQVNPLFNFPAQNLTYQTAS